MKLHYLFWVTLVVFIHPVKAQNTSVPSSCIKINMLSPVMSTVNLAFETRTAEDYSIQLGLAYMNHPTYGQSDGLTNAFFITPELRYKLSETKNGYAFIGVFGRYINMEYSRSETHFSIKQKSTSQYESIGAGVILGQKFIYKNRVAIELFGGPVYSGIISSSNTFYNRGSDDVILDEDVPYTLLRRYGLRAGFTIGWMF